MIKRLLTYSFLFLLLFSAISFAANELANQILVLKKLHDDGIITAEEFSQAKAILIEKAGTKSITTETKEETQVASLPKKIDEEDKETVLENFEVIQKGETHSSRVMEKMEMYFKDYKIYVSRPGTIKIRRVSDNKQLLTIQGDMNIKYYNDGKGLFDINYTKKKRPTLDEDIQTGIEDIKKVLKDPLGIFKRLTTPKGAKKKDKGEAKMKKDDIKLELKIDGVKLLHYEGRYVPTYKAFFYQVLTSGYEPFHFYITLQGKNPIGLNMEHFNKKIDRAIRKAKKRLAIEYDITEAQIDKIIQEQTGRATDEAAREAAQDAVKEAISQEVQAAVEQSVGEAMSAGLINAIEEATGEAIEEALEAELAAAIDAEIEYAVAQGIEEAAVTAGWQAYFDTLAAGGSDAQASTAAYEACGSACDNY